MKKTTITVLSLLLLSITASAQYRLQNSGLLYEEVVNRPFLYWDLMRDQQNSWIREYRSNSLQEWGASNLFINKKGADGEFNYLESSLWNWSTSQWDINTKHVISKEYTDGKRTTVRSTSLLPNAQGQLRLYDIEYKYEYENGKLAQRQGIHSNETGVLYETVGYMFYNAQGLKTHDSLSVANGIYYWMDRYTYNAEGLCTGQCLLMNTDTSTLNAYEYDANKNLTRYKTFYYDNHTLDLDYEEAYTYDAQNRISEVTVSDKDSTGFYPRYIYKHGYNSAGKLEWMCSYSWRNSRWNKTDSIFINFTGNKSDTSYGYISGNGTQWNSYPNYRFLFSDTRVGIKEQANKAIDFSIYPNPAKTWIAVNVDENKPVSAVVITDLLGKQFGSYTGVSDRIDISHLTPGIYLVRVETKEGSGVKKLVIE